MNPAKPVPLAFTTRRLLIRRYRTTDAGMLYRAARASIAEVFRFLPWCHPDYSPEDSRQWLSEVESDWSNANTYSFGIFSRDGAEFHGGCGIGRVDEHPIGNLGYWVKTASTRRGIATEAAAGLAQFAIAEIGLQRIEFVMSIHNAASKGVAEAAGGRFEGTLRNRLLLHGRRHDAYVYSITPEDLGL